MARKLAREGDSESGVSVESDSTDRADKLLLNRRRYVKLGAAATAAFLTGTAASSSVSGVGEEPTTYWTDFSEVEL